MSDKKYVNRSRGHMTGSRFSGWVAAGLIALLAAFAAQGAAPAAMVTDLQGSVVRSGGQRLAILAELGTAAQLELGADARVTLVHFASGRQFNLEGPGAFRVTGRGVESAGSGRVIAGAPLAAAYANVQLRPTRVAQASFSMRGIADELLVKLDSPAGTWLLEERPAFRWQRLPGATAYRFRLTDNTGRLLHEATTGEDAATLPAAVTLKAGETYAWQVNATLPDGRVAEGWAEFGIADADRSNRVGAAKPGPGASYGDRVLFALLLEDSGLHDAARDLWRELMRERPSDPRLQILGGAR